MSLTHQHLLAREHAADIPDTQAPQLQEALIEEAPPPPPPQCPSDSESQLNSADINDDDDDDDMIAPQFTEQAPALPAKSALRRSRMMDLSSFKLAAETQPPFPQTTPHDVYLSSEEDASSSADDFSDFDFESESEDSGSSTRRVSHEDTARVVSVIFAGKPSIVQLTRRSMSPISMASISSSSSSHATTSRLQRTSTEPTLGQRLSIISSSSGTVLHPPRTSSMFPRRLDLNRPQFLTIDPFAAAKTESEAAAEEQGRPVTPKSANMFKRTMSLVRKKSKPALNAQYAMQSRDNLSLSGSQQHMEQVEEVQEEPFVQEAQPSKPATYNEIIKSARRLTQLQPASPMSPISEPASPMTPNGGARNRLRHFSARRRSIKA